MAKIHGNQQNVDGWAIYCVQFQPSALLSRSLLRAPKCIVCLGAFVCKFGKMARRFRRQKRTCSYFVKKN
jgi:hypothetical protein